MPIAATQRLTGSILLQPAQSARPQASLVAGRLAGILAAAGALGLVFALFPLRTPAGTRADGLALACVLVVLGLGYAAAMLKPSARRLLPLLTLTALPVALLWQAVPLAALAFAALVLIAAAVEASLLGKARRLALPLGALAVPALVALAVFSRQPGAVLAGLSLLVPALVAAHLAFKGTTPVVRPEADEPQALLPALLHAALACESRVLAVTGLTGVIDAALTPDAEPLLTRFPEGSLVEATLIADRVGLMQLLSQAAHGKAPGAMTLRLREGPGGAGYAGALAYAPVQLRAFALPERADRVAVVIETAVPGAPASLAPRQAAAPSHLARALHDSMAPFNAGMGFLELVADPRLAPRDFNTLHDFAAEAHKAMVEAHRNAVLLGQWLRLSQDEAYANQRSEATPRRLLTETLRLLNLEEMERRGDLRVDPAFDAPVSFLMPINVVRFALAGLLRFGLGAARIDLELSEEAGDLVITLRRSEMPDHHHAPDAMQKGVEDAAAQAGNLLFEPAGEGVRRLCLSRVAASRRTADALRLAS